MKELRGKVAVVTGAASGIGRAISMELADRGVDLALCDIDAQGLADTANAVQTRGQKTIVYTVNVASREQMEIFAQQVISDFGNVHIVINNAGVSFMNTVADASIEDFEWIFGINFWGVVYGTKLFLPHLLQQPESHLVNISSLFGFIGVPSQAGYCATKFAVRGFTESLRQEMVGKSIGITSVHPGGVDSNIVRNSRFTQGFDVPSKAALVKHFKKMAITSPAQAATIIVQGIIDNNPRVIVGRDARLLDLVQRWLPVRYPRIVGWLTPKPE